MQSAGSKLEKLLGAGKRAVISGLAPAKWKAIVPYEARGTGFFFRNTGAPAIAEIKKNPRIEFIAGSGNSKVKGRAIARVSPGADTMLAEPYWARLPDGSIIEKSGKGWIPAPDKERQVFDLKFWLKASRFVAAPMSVIPVVTGSLMAVIAGRFNVLIFLAALAGGLFAHLGVNFLSDYNDYEKGFDTPGALSSHTGVLTRELAAPQVILKAAVVCFCVTVLSGIYLINISGWPVLIFGAIGLAGGASYTAGPLAIKYRGMGELLTSFLMGPLMVMGAYYVQTGNLNLYPLLVSLCLGLLVGSVTLANNIRDMVDDKKNGFITLPIKTGFIAARRLYYCFLAAPYLTAAGLIVLQPHFYPVLLVFISLPFAVKCIKDIKNGGRNSAEIRQSAVKTPYPLNSIRLYTMFSLAMLAGLALSFLAGMIFRYKII